MGLEKRPADKPGKDAGESIDELMGGADRLTEARILPAEGPLSPDERGAVLADLRSHLEEFKVRIRDVAAAIGVSVPTISQILAGKYQSVNLDDYVRSLNTWIEEDTRRRRNKPTQGFVETRVARRMMTVARHVVESNSMGLITGGSGVGKSMVCQALAEQFPAAIYLYVSKGNSNFATFRKLMFNALGMHRRVSRDTRDLTIDEQFVQKLKGSNRLIIVDQAHQLSDGALQWTMNLYDMTKCPVLFVATVEFRQRVLADCHEDRGQLFRRIGWTCDLHEGFDRSPGGSRPLFNLDEIRRVFGSGKLKLTRDAEQTLMWVANDIGKGCLGRCEQLVKIAARLAYGLSLDGKGDAETITGDLIHRAMATCTMDQVLFSVATTPPAMAALAVG